jgi:hypothetical protein
MGTITVFDPCTTQVEINELRDMGCENFVGEIVETKITCCCDQTIPCVKYLVRHLMKSCTNCMHVENWYCPSDLTEIVPPP